ncbi:hypothetical protein [Prauserella cavernicola]|uniref:Uncharacterized protein n=1 Tax=Prauserella cavernicola TaxID=2800127 RepID=A0A934V221_9PSEU|nr:hypothetical protein [Prauserella cavernicola]MBK1784541.1 hypothetical protein [Prauserella cavernicola]
MGDKLGGNRGSVARDTSGRPEKETPVQGLYAEVENTKIRADNEEVGGSSPPGPTATPVTLIKRQRNRGFCLTPAGRLDWGSLMSNPYPGVSPYHPPDDANSVSKANSRSELVGFWVSFSLLTLAGIGASFLFGLMFTLASDSCNRGATGWLCDAKGPQVAFAMPWIAWALAITASLIGFGLRRRRVGALRAGVITGACLYIVIVGITWAAVVSVSG